ncbi:MAG: polysaccharide deacetylase family protein, partial [Deltaproteobacteria bacterium]|nr:polysaccharide deacetylase family protein [Deltaproteobacteria bacterium]
INALLKNRYPVINLKQAMDLLDKKSLPSCPVVITFDDGFQTIDKYAIPILRQNGLPSTIFVTSYYCINPHPVFRLVVQYMLWKTSYEQVDLTGMGLPLSGRKPLRNIEHRNKIAWQIIDYAETELEENDRHHMALELGARLGLPYRDIAESGALSIMNAGEIESLSTDGVDIQLHTHRHHFPEDPISGKREISDNRSILEPLVGKGLNHFCYPSGLWSENHFSILREERVECAVTCDTGFNYPDTPRLALRRFLDGQHISSIEFEAELSGLMEIMRKLRSKGQSLFRKFNRGCLLL